MVRSDEEDCNIVEPQCWLAGHGDSLSCVSYPSCMVGPRPAGMDRTKVDVLKSGHWSKAGTQSYVQMKMFNALERPHLFVHCYKWEHWCRMAYRAHVHRPNNHRWSVERWIKWYERGKQLDEIWDVVVIENCWAPLYPILLYAPLRGGSNQSTGKNVKQLNFGWGSAE